MNHKRTFNSKQIHFLCISPGSTCPIQIWILHTMYLYNLCHDFEILYGKAFKKGEEKLWIQSLG